MKQNFKLKLFGSLILAGCMMSNLYAQVQYKIIPFTDIKPEGFPLQFCWNSLGVDPYDNVYIAFGNNNEWPEGEEDMTLFKYNNNFGIRNCLGTYNEVLDKAENRLEGEIVSKGHTDIVYMDGRMYIGTQPDASPINDLSDFRGSHLFAYDIALDSMIDLSKDLPDGVVQANRGIISMCAIPSMNYIVGYGNPDGDIIYYNTETATIDRIIPGDKVNNNITRNIIPSNSGNLIYSWGWERVYEYNFAEQTTTRTDYQGGKPFWSTLAINEAGTIAYIGDPEGTVFKLDIDNLTLSTLGTINPSGGGILCISLSADESTLYSIPGQYPYQLIGMDVSTGATSVIYTFPDEFGTGSYTFTGNNIVDSKNYLYFSRHQYNVGNNSDGTYDGELLVINLNSDLSENNFPEFEVSENFNTNIKDETDTIRLSNISDGDNGIQTISISTEMSGNIISDPEITYIPESQEALVIFNAMNEGTVNLTITVSDDGFGTSGNALETSHDVSITVSSATATDKFLTGTTIYPVPTTGILICDFQNEKLKENVAVKIYSLTGSLVFHKEFTGISSQLSLNLSELQNGNYILKIVSDETEIVDSPIAVRHE